MHTPLPQWVETRMLLRYRYVSSRQLRTCRCPQRANGAEGGEQCYTQMRPGWGKHDDQVDTLGLTGQLPATVMP
jgi:hypothetical protein